MWVLKPLPACYEPASQLLGGSQHDICRHLGEILTNQDQPCHLAGDVVCRTMQDLQPFIDQDQLLLEIELVTSLLETTGQFAYVYQGSLQ